MNNKGLIENSYQYNAEIRDLASNAIFALHMHNEEECRQALLKIMAITDQSNRTLYAYSRDESERSILDQSITAYQNMIDNVKQYLYVESKRECLFNTAGAI